MKKTLFKIKFLEDNQEQRKLDSYPVHSVIQKRSNLHYNKVYDVYLYEDGTGQEYCVNHKDDPWWIFNSELHLFEISKEEYLQCMIEESTDVEE